MYSESALTYYMTYNYTYNFAYYTCSHFLKVIANSADGNSQIAYETYSTELKTTLYGVLCFYVLPDGSVHASYFDGGD